MKKIMVIFFAVTYCILSLSVVTYSADYIVQSGDTIGKIAQRTGNSIAQLAQLNAIAPPTYIVRSGQTLRYLSVREILAAQRWLEDWLGAFPSSQVEYATFQQMLRDIKARNIVFDQFSTGMRANDIIVIADAYLRRR